jgi:hypothetical protein
MESKTSEQDHCKDLESIEALVQGLHTRFLRFGGLLSELYSLLLESSVQHGESDQEGGSTRINCGSRTEHHRPL